MGIGTSTVSLTPEEVERACERDEKRYELIDGELKDKSVGCTALFVAAQIAGRLNAQFYPHLGVAVVGAMVYCFGQSNHGRKPDVVFVKLGRLPGANIPEGDLFLPPDIAVEVLCPRRTAIDLETRLDEFLDAGIAMVWIVNPNRHTMRVYRNDGTTRLFHAADAIENDPMLPGFRLIVGDVFPAE